MTSIGVSCALAHDATQLFVSRASHFLEQGGARAALAWRMYVCPPCSRARHKGARTGVAFGRKAISTSRGGEGVDAAEAGFRGEKCAMCPWQRPLLTVW